MQVNRRNVITAAAVVVASPALASPDAAEQFSPSFLATLAAFESARNAHRSACDMLDEVVVAVGEDAFEPWTCPTNPDAIREYRHRSMFPGPFYCAATAREYFDRQIAGNLRVIEQFEVPPESAPHVGHTNAADRLRRLRDDAVADLEAKAKRLEDSGYNAASRRCDKTYERADAAFLALLSHPCNTIHEVRTKAAAIMAGREDDAGPHLEPDEAEMLLRSLVG
ncbi:MAG: hypothetical protein K5872_06525 [Rhizobiaceae bacterium]|nr:hypothetical protein [Rhizobiaceae bacterium]MCV0405868.1 hypothetical protein [Rhizobiaceae bacterium]